jgi:lysophospholipase L1-like esterase
MHRTHGTLITLKTLSLLIVLTDLLAPTLMAAQPVPPVNPAAYKAPVRVACIGDSITEGIGADQGKSYPAQLHLGLIDMHAALADHPQFLPDRVHPNTEGAAALAGAAFTALTGKPAPAAK